MQIPETLQISSDLVCRGRTRVIFCRTIGLCLPVWNRIFGPLLCVNILCYSWLKTPMGLQDVAGKDALSQRRNVLRQVTGSQSPCLLMVDL